MLLNSFLELGLVGLVLWFRNLIWFVVQQITQFFIIIRVQGNAFI